MEMPSVADRLGKLRMSDVCSHSHRSLMGDVTKTGGEAVDKGENQAYALGLLSERLIAPGN